MDSNHGHVFVVKGRIGKVVADAAVISTDLFFTVEDHWRPVIQPGETSFEPANHKPSDWVSRGWGRSPVDGREDLWFLDVASDRGEGDDSFSRLKQLLDAIAQSNLKTKIQGRLLPLVVLPVIGTRGGGQGARRGTVVDSLLSVCQRFVSDNAIDIAIVVPNPSSYGAIQHHRIQAKNQSFPNVDLEQASRLGRAAREGSLALFVGAGTSVPAGLPDWKALIAQLANVAQLDEAVLQHFKKLSPLDQAQLLHQKLGDELASRVVEIINCSHTGVPALAHTLLAGLDCQCAVTTNYDRLYEEAALNGQTERVTAVLPSTVPSGDQRWLLKMHGSLDRPESIVLTRGQFAGFDSAYGPSGAVLQSLLLTKHLLVVGTSMTDDNVLRLIHEVAAYRRNARSSSTSGFDEQERKFGTVVDVSADRAREALHGEHFHWLSMTGETVAERARQLEIFLDAVSMFASKDRSWLLDRSFEYLLTPEERSWADLLRDAADAVAGSGERNGAWKEVADALTGFGARPVTGPGTTGGM
ncbi:SIR2 family protein [Microlunatus panaciterrae]|uniref:SIR2-like domain-containing protein n=1 Tax=Microlunatus panaciterrae TaxID=400768 RepID=A0ABS2RFU8_9ACTN|nr:SIR2 family protein [Microlunatus panaciterrae]MBM7797871.1 hypothetical protein [Microlunatus panaciterrae]